MSLKNSKSKKNIKEKTNVMEDEDATKNVVKDIFSSSVEEDADTKMEDVTPEDIVIEKKEIIAMSRRELLEMGRRHLRYHLYRIRTEVDGGCEAPEISQRIKKFFETEEGVSNWSQFARAWDVRSDSNYDRITLRGKTEEEEWNEELRKNSKPLPSADKNVINFSKS